MNRTAAVEYLTGQYGSGANNLLALADVGLTDESGGLKEIIDDALLMMGTAYGDLATAQPGDAVGYRAALRYVALTRIIAGLNAKTQQGVVQAGTGISLDVREWIKRLMTQLALEKRTCELLDLLPDPDGTTGWSDLDFSGGLPRLSTDYLTPIPEGA